MSLIGRRTCVSASALSLDAQPAQADRVVRRISRPVWGMGMGLLNQNDRQSSLTAGHFTLITDDDGSLWSRCGHGWRDHRCFWRGGQWQDELVAAGNEYGLHTGRKFQDILILQ